MTRGLFEQRPSLSCSQVLRAARGGKKVDRDAAADHRRSDRASARHPEPILTRRSVVPLHVPRTARQLRALKDQEYVENLLNTVQTEARKLRKSRRGTRYMALCFGGVIALMVAAYCVRALRTGNWDMGDWFTYFFMFSSFGGVAAASRTHKEAVSELTRIEDIRAVGPLAESLAIEDKRVRPLIHAALIRLLPRLQSSDAALLTLEGRACLNDALDEKNEMLTLAILKAYEQVGDETALPYVEKLAEDAAASQKWRKSGSLRLADAVPRMPRLFARPGRTAAGQSNPPARRKPHGRRARHPSATGPRIHSRSRPIAPRRSRHER